MKKFNIHHYLMIAVVVIQILLGVALIFTTIYLDDNIYLELETFFYNFMFVPGAVTIFMCLYYLLFKKFDRHSNFLFTGAVCTFIITNTGEALVLFQSRFPEGWLSYFVWYIVADIATTAIVFVFNLFFIIAYRKSNVEVADAE